MDAKVCEWLTNEGIKKKSEKSHQSILTLLKKDFVPRRKIISGLQDTHKQNDQLLKVLLEKYPVYTDYQYVCQILLVKKLRFIEGKNL